MAAVPGHLHVHAYDYTYTDNEMQVIKKNKKTKDERVISEK